MKKAFENKEKLIKVLKTNVRLWNRYQTIVALKLTFKIDLSKANLSKANLSEADLSLADLSKADLSKAELLKANLSLANLSKANLSEANLSKANLDFSCWDLSCKTLSIKKTDIKLRIQICFHWMKLIENELEISDEEKVIYNNCLNYANKFHRTEIERLKIL